MTKIMVNNDFCVFILTHGRPDNVITYNTIIKAGYTGKIYIIIDNEDQTAKQYHNEFGDKVIMFDKLAVSKTFDEADNFNDRRTVVYARNACFEIANKLGIKYFLQLDDDYTFFLFRLTSKFEYPNHTPKVKSGLDNIFDMMVEFYKTIPAKSIAFAQGGDFIGGAYNGKDVYRICMRKAMNTFFCSTDRPFKFIGRINEDVNVYTRLGSLGMLFLTIPFISISQVQTQQNKGGMSDIYLDNGTYIKSFYTVIFQPSSVKVKLMHTKNKRLHHSINWKNTVPQIIPEEFKKE